MLQPAQPTYRMEAGRKRVVRPRMASVKMELLYGMLTTDLSHAVRVSGHDILTLVDELRAWRELFSEWVELRIARTACCTRLQKVEGGSYADVEPLLEHRDRLDDRIQTIERALVELHRSVPSEG